MHIRIPTMFFLIIFSSNIFASSIDSFFKSLSSELLLSNIGRSGELAQNLSVKPFNYIDRILSPDASAIYNGSLNQIKLDDQLLQKIGNFYSIKTAKEILGPKNMGIASLATIFHELGHAEMDILIENKKNLNDEIIMYQYNNKVKEIFKRNFSENSWTIFHEYFAYYRTNLIEGLLMDKDDIYRENGYRRNNKTCFLTNYLKNKLKERITLEEFQEFYSLRPLQNYRVLAAPRYIFVRGKDFDLEKISASDKKIISQTNDLFWMYHFEEYGFPTTQKILVERMNLRDPELKRFKSCREELYRTNI